MKKVLYFSTAWCGPCKTFKPVVQQVSQETGIPVTYLDADQDQEMAKKYNINSGVQVYHSMTIGIPIS